MNKTRTHINQLPEVWRVEDDWTGVTKKEERRKRQNRLNQRVYRLRNAEKDPTEESVGLGKSGKKKSFRVQRFRITEVVQPFTAPTNDSENQDEKPGYGSSPGKMTSKDNQALSMLTPEDTGTVSQNRWTALGLGMELAVSSRTNTDMIPGSLNYPNDWEETITSRLQSLTATILQNSLSDLEKSTFSSCVDIPLVNLYAAPDQYLWTATYGPPNSLQRQIFRKRQGSSRPYFPLSSDHLLQLIHYNSFRALTTIKTFLTTTTSLIKVDVNVVIPDNRNLCNGVAIILAKPGQVLPLALQPTRTQMNIAHSSWLNMFPFPRLRDNLIRRESYFSHTDFFNDLWGELFPRYKDALPATESASTTDFLQESQYIAMNSTDELDDEITARRRCLIIWGEPWDTEAWEVTPGFVRKWGWVLEGCEELIISSNRWRARRGENPLVYPFPLSS